jgi:ATP-dependent RNA helicase DeaD
MGKVSRRQGEVNQDFRCLYHIRPDATLPPAFTSPEPIVPLPDALHLSPTVAAALERLGWGADHPLLREAAPTAARGHNLVMVVPPAPAYGVPALAGILSRLRPGDRALLLAPPAQLQEWAATAHEVARGSGLRIEAAQGTARAARRLRAGEVELLIAAPAAALALHRRSALEPERLAAVVLAWPEGWEDGEILTQLMTDVGKDIQRVLLVESLDRAGDLVERYARRALTVGAPPAESAAPAAAGPVRVAGVAWERRAAALADLLELLDPASVTVWTVDRTRHGEIERAVGAGTPGVSVTCSDLPRAALVIAFDPPTPERLAQLLAAGEVVLLMPPGTERYLERIAAPRRPLRLPGLLDAVATEAGARRAAIVRAMESGRPDGALTVLAPLFERYDTGAVAAALYDLWTSSPQGAPAPTPEAPATSRIYVGIGKKDGATVNDLVAVLTKEVRVDRTRIGKVELKDAYALVEIPTQEAERIAGALNGTTIRRKRVTARVDRGPARPARPTRPRPAPRG